MTIDSEEVLKAMDRLQVRGKTLTYDSIAKETESRMTAYQVEGIVRRFRYRFQKDEAFVTRSKIIARHFGKNGERKLLG